MANDGMTRRGLLQAAGGITFLALVPVQEAFGEKAPLFGLPETSANGSQSAIHIGKALPLFTALPYIQPGTGASKLAEGDSMNIAWQTNGVKAEFEIVYGEHRPDQPAEITIGFRPAPKKEDSESRYNYHATLLGLKLGTRYNYAVSMNGTKIFEGYFTTRKPRGAKVHFVAFGDNSFGDISDRQIAYQAYLAKPDFVMNTGDNVYESGLDDEYARYFFPVYNADVAEPRSGAPLLRSVPFYTVIANHDVEGKTPTGGPVADFAKNPDSLAYYTNMAMPLNGFEPANPTPTLGPDEDLKVFKRLAGNRFPRMANYSFDYGDLHFTCLDSNIYVDPTLPDLQKWLEQDLSETDALWKIVVFHHPPFNVGEDHYAEQHMRVLVPILERHGVDLTLHGHEHTYQRTKPLRFTPAGVGKAKNINSKKRLVPGTFNVDQKFDGEKVTKPDGILYIVTGAGGKHLYDPQMNMKPASWLHEEDGNVAYVDRFISDRHSLTIFDVDGKTMRVKQIDEWGNLIDRFTVTK